MTDISTDTEACHLMYLLRSVYDIYRISMYSPNVYTGRRGAVGSASDS